MKYKAIAKRVHKNICDKMVWKSYQICGKDFRKSSSRVSTEYSEVVKFSWKAHRQGSPKVYFLGEFTRTKIASL